MLIITAMSPNAPDANTYTPMYVPSCLASLRAFPYSPMPSRPARHAAASYAHLDLLAYLMSKGGDINVTDEDGDTPLFTVESEETARWMVEHGARVDVRNGEGLTVGRGRKMEPVDPLGRRLPGPGRRAPLRGPSRGSRLPAIRAKRIHRPAFPALPLRRRPI